jgi:hypothetical protein
MGESTPLALGGVRWWAGPEIDTAQLRKLIAAADAALAAGARDQKRSRRKESFLLALEGAAPDYLLKVTHYESLKPWRRLGRSKARAELQRATALAARGIPTPIPVAAGELRRAGLLDRCYELVRWLPDATDLLRLWTEERGNAASRRAWTVELGALVRRMHDTGVDQEDLAPNNFLWRDGEAPRLMAIDFERTRLRARVASRERVFALAKLDRHFSGACGSARMRFLLAYAHGRRDEARRWWRAIKACVPQLAQRDAAHWARTGIEAGRRFDGLELDVAGVAWRGFQRCGAPVEALRAILQTGFVETSVQAAESCCVRRIEIADDRAMAIAWGIAQALYQRRLMPEPLAILRSRDAAVLATAHSGDLVALADAPATERRAALVVAIDRLLVFGMDAARLRPDVFRYSTRRRKALLLDPSACVPGRRSEPTGLAIARDVAARLLG